MGSSIGTKEFIRQQTSIKIDTWIGELRELVVLAKEEPQLAYSAYTFGLCKRWLYLMRTTPNISDLFLPLEKVIKDEFLPTIIGQPFCNDLRDAFALPTKYGGLGIFNPSSISDREYTYSRTITEPLNKVIHTQQVANVTIEDGNCDLFDTISKEIKVHKKNIRLRKNEVYTGVNTTRI